MKTIPLSNGPLHSSAIILGCMRMPVLSKEEAAKVISAAYDLGINFLTMLHATQTVKQRDVLEKQKPYWTFREIK